MTEADEKGLALAKKFKEEVLECFDTLTDIERRLGHETIIDMWYLTNALIENDGIDVFDADAGILVVVNELPSRDEFMKFVNVELDNGSKVKP